MALALSLRRALLVLLSGTVIVLMVLYWNQGGIQPPYSAITASFEKSKPRHVESSAAYSIPAEKIWSYRCEDDKCVRYHYQQDSTEKRVPFMTCSMTCGEVNIWPHPTIKTAVSTKSLRFTANVVQLKVDTRFSAVHSLFLGAFDLFVADLRRIQRLDFDEVPAASDGSGPAQDDGHDQRRSLYHGVQHVKGARGANALEEAVSKFSAKAFGANSEREIGDIDSFQINASIHTNADVHLRLDTDESYTLTIGYEKRKLSVQITANSFFGARHGLSTLQQLIWYDDVDNLLHVISKAVIVDAPKFRYRGVMLDTSRHFFSVEAIKRTIAGMSHAKLNRFHWHMTDSQSFPYISKYYPELAMHGAYSALETYTAEDVRQVSDYARLHGVQVVPEIDAPAHAGNGWDWGPTSGLGDLSLCINQQPWSFYCGEPPCGQLNPKNNHTYLILQRLYEELLNHTGPTDYFHLGGDEVNLECWGQYFNDTDLRGLWCEFMLNAMARLKVANNNVDPKLVSVWSSGLTNTKCLPKHQFAVQVWGGSSWQENYDLIDNGFNVIFSHVDAWYLDCGFGNWRASGVGACSPYSTWQAVYKHRPWDRMRLDNTRRKQVLGGEVCLWTEQVDEGQLDNRLWPRSAALGERLWFDPDDEHDMDVISQEVFKRMSIFRNRLVELGIKAEPLFPKYCAQNAGECI